MNIVFWSKYQRECATSGNMLAVSIMSSLVYSANGILVQLDNRSRSIDEVLNGQSNRNHLMEEYIYYNQRGIDKIFDRSREKDIDISDIRDNIISVKDTNMEYIPATKKMKLDLKIRELNASSKSLMNLLNRMGRYNFIDCPNGDRPVSNIMLKNADLIVINMCQNMDIEDILKNPKLMKKTVFLVGKYHEDGKNSLLDIRNKYGIERESIGAIPYNEGFHRAIEEGMVIPFLTRYISVGREGKNFDFINSVYKCTDMILKKAGFDGKND